MSTIKITASDMQGLAAHLLRKSKEPLSVEERRQVAEALRTLGR